MLQDMVTNSVVSGATGFTVGADGQHLMEKVLRNPCERVGIQQKLVLLLEELSVPFRVGKGQKRHV